MDDVKWIKIVIDVFDNRKIKQIERMPEGDAIIVVWFKLICLAGSCNKNGMIFLTDEIPYTEETLATEFRMESPQRLNVLRLALMTFERFEMIQIIDNVYCISSWEKYQNVEGLEKIREKDRIRKQRERDRKRQTAVCHVTCHADVTHGHATDIEIEIDKEIDIKDNTTKSTRFVPPTTEEVKAYCQERNNKVDADRFVSFYESKGWMVGKNKMKDWKASVRTWEKDSKATQEPTQPKPSKYNQYPQRDYSASEFDDIEKKLLRR